MFLVGFLFPEQQACYPMLYSQILAVWTGCMDNCHGLRLPTDLGNHREKLAVRIGPVSCL